MYSLANFCFGGNSGPKDMETMIFQQTFTFTDGKLQEDNVTNVIPCKVSSVYETGVNNYQPMPVEGEKLQEDNVTNVIPCKVSSVYETGVNNYQPMPVEGEIGDAILSRIEEYTQALQ